MKVKIEIDPERFAHAMDQIEELEDRVKQVELDMKRVRRAARREQRRRLHPMSTDSPAFD